MSEKLFDIIFKGKFISSIDKNKAVLHFSKLFKVPIAKAEHFFDGKPRALKKSLPLDKASHFRVALKKAGLKVSLVKQIDASLPLSKDTLSIEKVGAIIANKAFVQPRHFDTSKFHLDELGVEIVHPERVEKPEFDLSYLHIDELGVEITEPEEVPELQLDISEISMQEVGAIFAKKQIIAEPELDIDSISMEKVGATIVEKKKVPEPDINIDDIKLAD